MPETAKLPRTKFVHIELDFVVWAKLKKKLTDQNRMLNRHIKELILTDLGELKKEPSRA
jgi:macrodomain Ter protein organizer (MatP/YcbG family)